STSKRALLTVVGRVENRNMGWNADRTTVHNKWGTGPTQAEFVPFTLSLSTDGPRTVWSLDGNGRRKAKLPTTYRAGKLSFSNSPAHPSLWFEISK
ncbi:MAG TPA: hypothetical protein VK934_05145, partial [Fimbriimonas sp.]|nr:hypothetical protein [Fimbriimonas sp.]